MPGRAVLPGRWRVLLLTGVLLWCLPLGAGNDYILLLFNVMALNAMVVLGLNLLIGSTGQVSLGHAAFYGMGAYLSAIASTTWHWPLPLALLFALAAVGVTGFLLALPTLRLEGNYLVMATLGFNIIVTIVFTQMEGLTGGPSGLAGIPRISLGPLSLNSDLKFYFFIWTVFLVMLALTLNLTDSRIGRALKAVHQKELTARVLGIPSYRYKVTTFVLSTLYAAFAGFCYAHYVTFISPKTFDIFYSLQVVTMVVAGGMGSLWGGLVGTVLLTVLPEVLHRFEDLHVLLYGLILMGMLVFAPQGLVPAIGSLVSSRRSRRKNDGQLSAKPYPLSPLNLKSGFGPVNAVCASAEGSPSGKSAEVDPVLLSIQDISLGFGGLQALREIGFDLARGRIVSIIGPNGAGKTTLLNVISGLLRPDTGRILLRGQNVVGRSPCTLAARGIGRTFQTVQTFQDFSVVENVLLGYHLQGKSGFPAGYLHTPAERFEENRLRGRAMELLEDFRLADKAEVFAQRLSLLEQKLLELARALALSPSILLLDEPAGGLNPRESEMLVDTVSLLRQRGMGILLVEHDMNVVMSLSDRVEVLQHGHRIAAGTPREIQSNPQVIAAYLGSKKK